MTESRGLEEECPDDAPAPAADAVVRVMRIVNEKGLHARASAKFVKMASGFDAEVTVSKDGHTVDARSIMGLMMLAAGPGAQIEIAAEGPQAEEAASALSDLVTCRFEEER